MQKFIPAIFFIFVTSFVSCVAQQLPLFTQYMFDPYLVNPSMVASTNSPEVNLLYRRQWAKVEDGPKTLQFDAQLPLNKRMALGINIYDDRTVLLSATSALLTFGYKIPLATDHILGFGLSGGIFSNRIRLEDVPLVDSGDPALLSTATNNIALNGQAGVHYSYKNFLFGASLLNLVDRKTVSEESFQEAKFGQLKNAILFASYKLEVAPGTWYVQPNLAYRMSQDKVNYFEASALISYKKIFDIGGGYRQDFGPTVMARLHLKNLQVGFAYDLYSNNSQISPAGTQELQLKWRFGKDDEPSSKGLKKNSTPFTKAEEKLKSEHEKEEPIKPIKDEPKVTEPVVSPKKEEMKDVEPKPTVRYQEPEENRKNESDEGLYFVVGTFENKSNAEQLVEAARKRGFAAQIKESKSGVLPHYYYVHLPKFKLKEVSLEQVLELQKITGYKDAWFSKID